MNEVEIRLLPDKLCEKAYGGRFYKNMMKCAGKVKGGIDTCQVSRDINLLKKELCFSMLLEDNSVVFVVYCNLVVEYFKYLFLNMF